jgi:hypothetical protein
MKAIKDSDSATTRSSFAHHSLTETAQQLLLAVKKEEDTKLLQAQLKDIPYEELLAQLEVSDDSKLCFWINIYNSFYQILRKELKLSKKEIYGSKSIPLAGKLWSLDDVEHGVLRKRRYKHGYGYIPNLFVPDHVKRVAVSKIDCRVHFALNCGAQSCPRIAYYTPDKLDEQLKRATFSFLSQETQVVKNEIRISKLFYWFHKDFGGNAGILKIMSDVLDVDTKGKKIVYNEYSWEENLENFAF